MKKTIILFTLSLVGLLSTAQKIPFEILDSLSNSIALLERRTENNLYKDLNENIFQLSFPEEHFKVWSYNRLASKAVYKQQIGGNEILSFTDNIDLTKATALLVEEPHNGIAYIKLEFPKGFLKTQLVEDGQLIETLSEDYLEFFCLYGKLDANKKFMFDNLYDHLLQLCMRLKIEKGLMKEEDMNKQLADWGKISGEAFAAKYPNSLLAKQAMRNTADKKAAQEALERNQNVILSYMEQYKFKRGLRLSEFTTYNKEADHIIKKSNYRSYGNTAAYSNVKGIGGKPFPDGPFLITLESTYSDIVTRFEHIIISEKNEQQVRLRYQEIITELESKLDKSYISNSGNHYKFIVPGAAADITIRYMNYNKWHAIAIAFD